VCTHQNTICCRPSATEGSRLPEAYFVIYFSKKNWVGWGWRTTTVDSSSFYILGTFYFCMVGNVLCFIRIFWPWQICRRCQTQFWNYGIMRVPNFR
jgi:hypothetical protein